MANKEGQPSNQSFKEKLARFNLLKAIRKVPSPSLKKDLLPEELIPQNEDRQFFIDVRSQMQEIKDNVTSRLEPHSNGDHWKEYRNIILLREDGSFQVFNLENLHHKTNITYDVQTERLFYIEASEHLIGPKSYHPQGHGVQMFEIRVLDYTKIGIGWRERSDFKIAPQRILDYGTPPLLEAYYSRHLDGNDNLTMEEISYKFGDERHHTNNRQRAAIRYVKEDKGGYWEGDKYVPDIRKPGFYPEDEFYSDVPRINLQTKFLEKLGEYKELFRKSARYDSMVSQVEDILRSKS